MTVIDQTIYRVEREEEDGVESFRVFRFLRPERTVPAPKRVIDTFPSKEEADGEAAHMNAQFDAYYRKALTGTAAFTRSSDPPDTIAERAYSIALAAVEVFTK